MKAKLPHHPRFRVGVLAPLLLVAAAPAYAVDCSRPGRIDEVRACQAAAKGMTALRQFRDSRRGIYQIELRDYEQAIARVAKEEAAAIKVARADR